MATTGYGGTGRHRRSWLAVAVVGGLVVSACTGGESTAPTTSPAPSTPAASGGGSGPSFRGIRLSKGTAPAGDQATPVVEGEPLDEAAVGAVVARLPAWQSDPELEAAFRWPTSSAPVPRAGTTIDTPFPAPVAGPPPPAGTPSRALTVLRAQPDGPVAVAPFATVTFDRPMVAVATVGQLATGPVPARLEPTVPGRWQWLGTQTLRFDATVEGIDRLPMATEYTLTVPAGTTSPDGAVLAADAVFRFATPPPSVQDFQPQGTSVPLTPVFVATFDQRVEPAAVLRSTTLTAGGATRQLRLATATEIEADDLARQLTQNALAGRWVAFVPAQPLPADAAVRVTFAAGTPSAEGPRTSSEAASFDLRTYPPLRVVRAGCDAGDRCPPGSGLVVEFSNPLDAAAFDPASVTIDPPLPAATVAAYGTTVVVSGPTKARTTYRVTFPASLADVFGQRLGTADTRTLTIGPASPSLAQLDPLVTTLDPFAAPALTVRTVNHDRLRVRIYRVTPEQLGDHLRWVDETWYRADPRSGTPTPPFPLVSDTTVPVAGPADTEVETSIDLRALMPGGRGHAVVLVETTRRFDPNSAEGWANRPAVTWAQATRLATDAVVAGDRGVVWVTDLRDGTPRPRVGVRFTGTAAAATTDASGVAAVRWPSSGRPWSFQGLVARDGDDTAVLPVAGVDPTSRVDSLRWYVADDRGTYRPGETVRVKGWVRRYTGATDGRLKLPGAGVAVTYRVSDGRGVALGNGEVRTDALGGFDLAFDLPASANTGPATVSLTVGGAGTDGATHGFTIAEFRRPEFEVTTNPQGSGPFVRGAPLGVEAAATYYAGGPLGAAPVSWTVTTQGATYAPPGWEGFTFGIWEPWWWADAVAVGGYPGLAAASGRIAVDGRSWPGPVAPVATATFTGTTDAAGRDYLRIDVGELGADLQGLPVAVRAEAAVTDVNRQVWASSSDLLVHPAAVTVGLRGAATFVRQGAPLTVEAIVTDVDGAAVAGRPVVLVAGRVVTEWANGTTRQTVVEPQECRVTSAGAPVRCEFDTPVGGTYRIDATVTDAQGRTSRSQLTRWVSGPGSLPDRRVQRQQLTVVPDAREYRPGGEATLLVQAPFEAGHGLATVVRNGVRRTVGFRVADASAVVRVPITEDDVPGVEVLVEVAGATGRVGDDGRVLTDAPPVPAFATGQLFLRVSTASRTLTVTAAPRDPVVLPGGSTSIDVRVAGPDGAPVAGAQLLVVVADEAVLALGASRLADPLEVFYRREADTVATAFARQAVVLAGAGAFDTGGGAVTTAAAESTAASRTGAMPTMADAAPLPATGGGAEAAQPGIVVRTDTSPLALFVPSATTGADGAVSLAVTVPDNLTRYRVSVVAVSGDDRFGSAESTLTAQLPLAVRPSAPRFLNFGDAAELPVVVQNRTAAPMTVDVVAQVDQLTLTGPAGRRVVVPAGERVEVRFDVAARRAGTARVRIAAAQVGGAAADAAVVEFPVFTPATSEAFATYGVVEDGATVQPILAPTGVIAEFGGLDVTTSSTSLHALTDAVLYLHRYDYETADASASRILAIAALRDVLAAFDAPGLPPPAELAASVERDLDRLVALQNVDGGFAWWRAGEESSPFVTVQATHALVVAGAAGYRVPDEALRRALARLATIEELFAPWYDESTKEALSSYALWVRNLAGERDGAKATALFERRRDRLALDSLAWLWPVVDSSGARAAIERTISNRAVDTAGAVSFTSSVGETDYVTLRSERRTDGIVLDSLIAMAPRSDLIPKVVNGLLSARRQGRWDNVQENAFILLALKRYFDTYESATPDFVARVWLGDRLAAETVYQGRSTERNRVTVPTAQLQQLGDTTVVIARQAGPSGRPPTGRLSYRIGLRTAPADLRPAPLDRGFVVSRTYEAVDDPGAVTRDADGSWRVKAGALVRVRLTMVAESRRTHVALVDPLPAGFEIVDTTLATTASVPGPPDTGPPVPLPGPVARAGVASVRCVGNPFTTCPWDPTWWEYENRRDDRAEAFATWLDGGVYDYSYVARATTPGRFVAPPTRAEEVYAPETFGRGASDVVVVA